jgi:hypothetical protein
VFYRTRGVVGSDAQAVQQADSKPLEGGTTAGESPVETGQPYRVRDLSTTNPGEFVGSRGDHPPRLNTFSDR